MSISNPSLPSGLRTYRGSFSSQGSPCRTPRADISEQRRSLSSHASTPEKRMPLTAETPAGSRVSGTPSSASKVSVAEIPGTPNGSGDGKLHAAGEAQVSFESLRLQLSTQVQDSIRRVEQDGDILDAYLRSNDSGHAGAAEREAAKKVLDTLKLEPDKHVQAQRMLRSHGIALGKLNDLLDSAKGHNIGALCAFLNKHRSDLPSGVVDALKKIQSLHQRNVEAGPDSNYVSAPSKVEPPAEKPAAAELPGLAELVKRNADALARWALSGEQRAVSAVRAFEQAAQTAQASGDISHLTLYLSGAPEDVRTLQRELQEKFVKPQGAVLQRLKDALEKRIDDVMTDMTRRNLKIEALQDEIDAQGSDDGKAVDPKLVSEQGRLAAAVAFDRNNILQRLEKLDARLSESCPVDQTSFREMFLDDLSVGTALGQEARECALDLFTMTQQAGASISRWCRGAVDLSGSPASSSSAPRATAESLRLQLLDRVGAGIADLKKAEEVVAGRARPMDEAIQAIAPVKKKFWRGPTSVEKGRLEEINRLVKARLPLVKQFERLAGGFTTLMVLQRILRSNDQDIVRKLEAFNASRHDTPLDKDLKGAIDAFIAAKGRSTLGPA